MSAKHEEITVITTNIPENSSVEVLGAIFATACYCKSLPKDLMVNVKNWTVGGELNAYEEMMEQSVSIALAKLRQKAAELGATAIYGFRIAATNIAVGAAEVIVYGTAVKKG